jgi:hypothetical protein
MPLSIGGCRSATGILITLKQGSREPNRDRGAVARSAHDLEFAATDLRALAHHRHPKVTLGARRARIESLAVVAKRQDDVLAVLRHRDPDIGRVGVLQGVHDALPRDVEDQQGDRRGELDVLHIVVEPDA